MDLSKQEEQTLRYWKQIRAFEKSVESRPKGRSFVFYEGPPTANGRPGIHHFFTRAFKDIILRYKTMQGYRVERKAGWDTHGLPVEVEVEKALGLKSKKEIEKYGIARFNQKCRESVWRYKKEWDLLTERMAFWIDLKNPYITYDPKYMETLWWIIKQAHERGLLYEGHRVAPYCPRCGTTLSSHEVGLGYEDVTEDSVFVKFEIRNPKFETNSKFKIQNSKTYLFAWTTTPWTLPGNVALAVGEKIVYALVKQGDEHYILAKDRLNILEGEYKIVKEFKGKDLLGLEYKPPFDIKELRSEKSHKIYAADFVSTDEGTGIVHIAVMYGEDDYNLGEKEDLPKVHTVDEAGRFNKLTGFLEGKFVRDKETDKEIIIYLKKGGIVYKKEKYTHPYPFCWRCRFPLIYYATQSWFIKMSSLRYKLVLSNKKINWMPAHIKEGRFGEWLREVKDWNFSRSRYWGTPLPVWRCKVCREIKVVGSIKELAGHAPRNEKGEIDLHRPYVDKIALKCQKCTGRMERVPDLVDVWFDSGSMPFAKGRWPFAQNPKSEIRNPKPPKDFPADYITEAVDQTRGWFYTLLAVSTILGLSSPYKNVISLGHILDKEGKKMSKSKGNVVDPWAIIEKYGSDAARWYFYTLNQPWDSKNFDETDLQKSYRKFISTLANTLEFYRTYRSPTLVGLRQRRLDWKYPTRVRDNLLDKWVVSRLNSIIGQVTKKLDAYDVTGAARTIEGFAIDDISNWYVRRSRKRFQNPETKEEKERAENVLAHLLLETSKLSAPFVPFLSEEVFQELQASSFASGGRTPSALRGSSGTTPSGSKLQAHSVHWENFPKTNRKLISKSLEEKMASARKVVGAAHELRSSSGIRVRQPLSGLRFNAKMQKEIYDIIREEVNVKSVGYRTSAPRGWKNKKEGNVVVSLDTRITPALREEGLINEFIRNIQELRKAGGLVPKDKIEVRYKAEHELGKILNRAEQRIESQNNARSIFGEFKKEVFLAEKEFAWEGNKIWIGIKKMKK